MMRHFRSFERVPTLFMLLALALFIALGSWQMGRKQWKESLLEHASAAQSLPPMTQLPASGRELKGAEFRKVALSGTFLPEQSLYMGGRFRDGESGYFLLTPLKLEGDGRIVLVNRGFIPGKMRRLFEQFKNKDHTLLVEGMLRLRKQKRLFVPDNHPVENIWFWEDIPAMEAKTGLKLLPVVIDATQQKEAGQYPIANPARITLRNDHFGYALTWFALALVAIGMFLAYHYKKRES